MALSKATVFFACPVEQVWRTVTDLSRTAWRSDLVKVEIFDECHFAEHDKSGHVTRFAVTVREPLRVWAFTMENENMTGSWEGVFETAADGTRLHCTERIRAKHWWMRPLVPAYLKHQQRLYLDDLKKGLLK